MANESSKPLNATSMNIFKVATDSVLAHFDYSTECPWGTCDSGKNRFFNPDWPVLETLLSIPVAQHAQSQSGRLGKAIDSWIAHELRRAGFPDSEIFPQRGKHRVMPAAIKELKESAFEQRDEKLFRKLDAFGKDQFSVVGEFYPKQIDVFMGSLERGPDLMVSTKSMSSSFNKNISNRYEEFLGDAENLRTRFPLATISVVYLVDSSILESPSAFKRLTEMLLRLDRRGRYDSATLIVEEVLSGGVSWKGRKISIPDVEGLVSDVKCVSVVEDSVPEELRISNSISKMIKKVLERLPGAYHEEARRRMKG